MAQQRASIDNLIATQLPEQPALSPDGGSIIRKKALHAAHWQQRLSELAGAHKVPGATLGILRLG